MIPFDFIYCRPSTLKEALDAYRQLQSEGKNPVYYAGGSEIITLCRAGEIRPGGVIDLKNIPECKALALDERALHIGSVCTLNQIKESKLFNLLRLACGRIADHTNQCRITLGGNLCGSIIYRETSLPLLISEAELTLFGPEGERRIAFDKVFKGRMELQPGELVLQIHIPSWALKARHYHVKKTQNEKIDYPLVSLAALWKENRLRIAVSGLCSHPFRSDQMEAVLNNRALSRDVRSKEAAAMLPLSPLSDRAGSGEYCRFVFQNTLHTLLEEMENGKI